jgi:hypothetical protein
MCWDARICLRKIVVVAFHDVWIGCLDGAEEALPRVILFSRPVAALGLGFVSYLSRY